MEGKLIMKTKTVNQALDWQNFQMKKKQTLILLSQMGSDILHLCKSNFFQQIKNTV